MKKTKLILFLGLIALLAMLLIPTVLAADVTTVYLDPANGSDTANGLTEAAAVKSVDVAYGLLKNAEEGKIVLLSDLTLTGESAFGRDTEKKKLTIHVTLTSKTGKENISCNNALRFYCPSTLENITVTLTKDSATANQAIYGEGNKLVIGENVTSVAAENSEGKLYYYSLSGGSRWSAVNSTDLTVKSGTWRNCFANAYGYSGSTNANVKNNCKVTITGGHFTGSFYPMYQLNTISGNVELTVSNATLAGGIYCAPAVGGTVAGNVTATIGAGADVSPVYCGSTKAGNVGGTATVILDGIDQDIATLSGKGLAAATGTIGSSRLVLKSGTLFTAPKNFNEIDIRVTAGKTMTLQNCELTVDSASSEGTLAFAGVAKLTAEEVIGTVNCAVTGEQVNNHEYVTAPAGSGIVFPQETGITENNGVWLKQDLSKFQGLILTAAQGVTFDLYTGFSEGELVEPYAVEGNSKFYPGITGRYRYVARGEGRYTVQQNVWMSEEEALTRTVIDVTPGLRADIGGWEPDADSVVKMFTEEMLEKVVPSSPDLWPEYKHLLVTPAFSEGRAEHLHTTQSEMEAFIASLDDADDNMYVYTLNTTDKGHKVPLVIYTTVDLTGKTLEEAAALIVADSKANGKLTVHQQCLRHGDEAAGGETGLAMLKAYDEDFGEKILDKMNIYVIPWLNPNGAQANTRHNPSSKAVTGNGDYFRLGTQETFDVLRAMELFDPHVMLDNHEADVATQWVRHNHADMLISPGWVVTSNTQQFLELGMEITEKAFADLKEQSLSYNYYSTLINQTNGDGIRGYAANEGRLFFLMETCGGFGGRLTYERRVVSGVVAVQSLLTSMYEDAANVKALIEAEQAQIIAKGAKFTQDNLVPLTIEKTEHEEFSYELTSINTATGEGRPTTVIPTIYDNVTASRVAPTAYVIPTGESWTAELLQMMDVHDIQYVQLPAGSKAMLRGYTGTAADASLTAETEVTFPNGAYVFTMNQVKAKQISKFLEPGMPDVNGPFDNKIIPISGGVIPVYRYERDLNSQGMMDYTAPGGEYVTPTLEYVVLRPSAAGIYYVGQFNVDEAQRANVESYGVVLSLEEAPVLDEEDCAWSTLTQWTEEGAGYGTVLIDVMTKNGGYSSNQTNANRTIYGVAYIKYKDGTVTYSDQAQYSLRQVAEAADARWSRLEQEQKDGLLAMYREFTNVMRSWNLPNVKAVA